MSLDVLALGDDAIAEGDITGAALQFVHLKARAAPPHIESLAFALRCEEHAIAVQLHYLGEINIELHRRAVAREARGAEILEPMLGTLHAMEQARRAVGERHDRILDVCKYLTLDDDIAKKDTGVGVV